MNYKERLVLAFKNVGKKKPRGKIDLTFLILVFVILTIGLIMLFSASHVEALYREGDSFYYIRKQLIFAVVGIIAMPSLKLKLIVLL